MLPEIDTEKKYTVMSGVLSYTAPFPLYEKTDVSVVWSVDGGAETTLTLDSDYSVDIADNGESGTVTLVEGRVPVGATLALKSAVPETQELDLSHTSDVDTEALEKELDRQVQMIQQLHDEVDRSIRVPVTGDTTPEELQEQLFTARDEAQEAASAAQAAQAAAESCRDEACECASEAAATLENAVTVIKEQEQASVEVVKNEGDTQAKRLEDIATTILISSASYNKSVSVKLTSPITNGETYTLPESMAYLVGRSQLYVSGNGVWFYKGFQYEEVGTDGIASTQIKFLQDLAVDDVLTFTLLANRVNVLTATNSGLVNDADGHLKLNVDGQTVLINASGQVYVPVMVGATASTAGTSGNVPAPQAGDQDRPLTGGGIYATSIKCAASSLSGILLSQVDDTPNWWREKGNAIFSVNKIGLINNQPSQYGTIINTAINDNLQQIYIVQPDGEIYKRGANATGWNGKSDDNGTWRRVSNTMPVGSIYVQFARQSDPGSLFGGTWENVSFIYADQFFRAEGVYAATFGGSQNPGLPNIVAIGTGYWRSTHVSSPQSGAAYTIYDQGDLAGSGSNPESVRTGAIDASKSNSIYGAASEVRPINSTIRIWKRKA